MKRMILSALASSLLALALPAAALAHHHRHHHARHHAHHARVLTFRAASSTSTTNPSAPSEPSGEAAGTVTSFSGGVLTITLGDGTVVSGKVTERTEISCPSASSGEEQGDDDQGDDQGDDQDSTTSGGQSSTLAHESDLQGGEDQGDDDQGQESCSASALVPGAKVGEAELEVSSAGAVWEKVVLVS